MLCDMICGRPTGILLLLLIAGVHDLPQHTEGDFHRSIPSSALQIFKADDVPLMVDKTQTPYNDWHPFLHPLNTNTSRHDFHELIILMLRIE